MPALPVAKKNESAVALGFVAVGAASALQSAKVWNECSFVSDATSGAAHICRFLAHLYRGPHAGYCNHDTQGAGFVPIPRRTHVHHLNYGIFLLAPVAAVLLFAPLSAAQRSLCALIYGASMAFDLR